MTADDGLGLDEGEFDSTDTSETSYEDEYPGTGMEAEEVESYEADGPGSVTDSIGESESVIPAFQPGGPGYEPLFEAPEEPVTSIGEWWGTPVPATECCVPLPGYEPPPEATEPVDLAFVAEGPADPLPGFDSNGDGLSDFVLMDATQTGQVDSWLLDCTGTGVADTMYLDTTGFGLPTAVCTYVEDTGAWTEPQSVIPWGQPGGPDDASSVIPADQPGGPASEVQAVPWTEPLDPAAIDTAFASYEPGGGVDLSEVCRCTTDPVTQQATVTIANDLTPAPEPLLDPATDTETPPPSDATDVWAWTETAPSDWELWTEPEVDPDSYTDEAYSPEWGTVTPEWAEEGESPFPRTEPEVPLETLVGPGHELDLYWAYQGDTNYCVLYSVRAILSELYGVDVDVNEMIERADRPENDWLVRDANGQILGILNSRIDEVFASYGVAATEWTGEEGAWQALNTALDNNQRIVLSLDSKELDAGQNVGDFAGALDSDHVVSVGGVDYAKGVVIVNDSARSAGLEIPITTFYEAWRDSGFSMTITDVSAPTPAGAVPPPGAGEPLADAPGFALLGMTLHLWRRLADEASLGALEAAADDEPGTAATLTATGDDLHDTNAPAADWHRFVVACCMPVVAEEGSATAEYVPPGADAYGPVAVGLEPMTWIGPEGRDALTWGHDLSRDGRIDFVSLAARRTDGVPDTWLFDLTGEGVANVAILDADGDGVPESATVFDGETGTWSDVEVAGRHAGGEGVSGDSVMHIGGDPTGVFASETSGPGTTTIGGPTDIGLGETAPAESPSTISIGGDTTGLFPDAPATPGTIEIGGVDIPLSPDPVPPTGPGTLPIGGLDVPLSPDLSPTFTGLADLWSQTTDPALRTQLENVMTSLANQPMASDWLNLRA